MSTYYAILTAVGEAKLANATALGTVLQLSKMAVGDGDGALPTPVRTQTALVRETYRADLNALRVDPVNASQIIAEMVIPETEGGYWLREMGIYDAAGDLCAVANCPPSYKPQMAEGSGRTQVLRMVLIVSSTAAVQLKIDPSVVLATREFVTTTVATELAKLDGKQSVRVATLGPVSANGLSSIDGVQLVAGDRVLRKNENDAKLNGIYVAANGAWPRAADADASTEVTPGMLVPIESGQVNGDSLWQLVTDAPIVLGTTPLTFEIAAGPVGVAAGTYRSVTIDKRGRVIGGTNPTTLAGYGITDDVQWRTESLTGKFTIECLDVTQSGQESGILIRTKIPIDSTVMPHLTIKGCINGYTSPFEMQLSWYFYDGAFYLPTVFISGYYSPLGGGGVRAFLSHENGLVNIRIDFGSTAYIPRLAITAYKSAGYGGNYGWYTGWVHLPWNRENTIAGEVMANAHTALSTANISATMKDFIMVASSPRQMRQFLELEAPGSLIETFSRTPPPGTLKANGAAVSRSTYARLDAAIYVGEALNSAAAWGYRCTDPGNPTGTRNSAGDYIVLPDARAEFRRGFDDGANRDPGREWASWQDQSLQGHTHSEFGTASFLRAGAGGISGPASSGLTAATGVAPVTGSVGVTRPRNINPLVCIRY
ncbi:phage tail protein [Pseudomonas sp. URMO17WK12:I2]|uniref:phage tail protein n=1 Tax=Pseudomonas sp. URMO17WK12:I2 TaxID=1261623 RepID=UPI000DB307F8|nr:phage tail protein [Pseudomonas sp. URMO17WK12:I2]PZW46382.1 tail-collar fiber protein [Pseudomonas sp. URMO17WK12:I2]